MTTPSDLGVFTTLLVQNGQPKWLREHLTRLAEHAGALELPYPGDHVLSDDLSRAIKTNDTHLIRIALNSHGHDIAARQTNAPSQRDYQGAQFIVTDTRVDNTLATIKTSHLAPYRRAREAAITQGAFEGLLVDEEGHVVDGSRSSPILFSHETLISLEGGLRGVTREKVLESAKALGLHVAREKRRANQLDGLLLVAGSGIGLVPGERVRDIRIMKLIERFRL